MKISIGLFLFAIVVTFLGCGKKDKIVVPSAVKPTIGIFTLPAKAFGDLPFTIQAPKSNSGGVFKYTSSNVKVAEINGSSLVIKGSGTAVITASQAASDSFLADSVTASFTVGLSAPGLSSFKIPNKNLGDPVFALQPPVSKSTGAFTYKSVNPGVATVSGNKVTIKSAGLCAIVVMQAASGNYRADSLQAAFLVSDNLLKPTITNFIIADKRVNDPAFALTKPTSNSTGTFTYKSENPTVATVAGNVVTLLTRGQCTIVAFEAAAGKYRADSIKATFNIAPLIVPTLTNFSVPQKKSVDAPFSLVNPISNSIGSFSYTSTNNSVATVSGNLVTIKGGGQTDIIATQGATGAYASANIRATLTVTGDAASGTVTDVDGNVYGTVTIGTQVWLAQNLQVTHYRDGTPIPNIVTDVDWRSTTTGGYCNYQDVKTYGRLYNYYAVINSHLLAPKGFHIPTDAEWAVLYNFIGGTQQSGVNIQEAGTEHWVVNMGKNTTKFTGLPAGARDADYTRLVIGKGYDAYWWSTTLSGAVNAWAYNLYAKGYLERQEFHKTAGFSVRCIKD